MENNALEYGIICQKDDEKRIVKNINGFLKKEYGYRKMYKWPDDSVSCFRYEYLYCQFIKESPRWHFDLFPNEDLDGKWKFGNKEAQWILFVSKINVKNPTEKEREEVDLFFKRLIEATGFETVLLYTYKPGEERLGNLLFDDDGNEIEDPRRR